MAGGGGLLSAVGTGRFVIGLGGGDAGLLRAVAELEGSGGGNLLLLDLLLLPLNLGSRGLSSSSSDRMPFERRMSRCISAIERRSRFCALTFFGGSDTSCLARSLADTLLSRCAGDDFVGSGFLMRL